MALHLDLLDTFPVLKTRRLTLRDIQLSDAPAILAMRADPRVGQFIPRPLMAKEEDAVSLVERTRKAFETRQAIGWAGILRENEEIIGTCGFNQIDIPNQRAEIGGELSVHYWGTNVALEAVQEIIRFGIEALGLHTIEAKVMADNRSAIFLLERLGFCKEAHFKDRVYHQDRFLDMAVYTLFADAYRHLKT